MQRMLKYMQNAAFHRVQLKRRSQNEDNDERNRLIRETKRTRILLRLLYCSKDFHFWCRTSVAVRWKMKPSRDTWKRALCCTHSEKGCKCILLFIRRFSLLLLLCAIVKFILKKVFVRTMYQHQQRQHQLVLFHSLQPPSLLHFPMRRVWLRCSRWCV